MREMEWHEVRVYSPLSWVELSRMLLEQLNTVTDEVSGITTVAIIKRMERYT
jgi:hypothetical protein